MKNWSTTYSRHFFAVSISFFILLMTDCREPFEPDFVTGQNDFLVVEGYIHIGPKAVTTITLSRVSPISEESQVFENDASLFIEDKAGTQYPLIRKGDGIYRSDSLNLDFSTEYQLLIIDANDNQFASRFTQPKNPPPIDSLHWKWKNDGIQMYVSTHDPANSNTYYKWDYKETWEVRSAYVSDYIWKDGQMQPRGGSWRILYQCWASAGTTELRFASTREFDSDAIDYPIVLFNHYDDRTSVRYSLLVEQRGISKEEFEFLELIKKNSGVTGSLFDPMPSGIGGNIQSLSNSGERVIGFIGASASTAKRIFVTREEFGVDPQPKCATLEIEADDFGAFFSGGSFIPITYAPSGNMLAAGSYCMDCRLKGKESEPDFW